MTDDWRTRWPTLPKAIGPAAKPITTSDSQKQTALTHINKALALTYINKALTTLLLPVEGDHSCEYEIVQDLAVVAKHLQARIK